MSAAAIVIADFFSAPEIDAVSRCFGAAALPDLVVEYILRLRVVRQENVYGTGERDIKFYKDGQAHGKWMLIYKNGMLRRSCTYKNQLLDGMKEDWYENGKIMCRGGFKNNKSHGKWEGWYPNGQQRYVENYTDGNYEKDKERLYWRENGERVPARFIYFVSSFSEITNAGVRLLN